jgi:hypothetical protein
LNLAWGSGSGEPTGKEDRNDSSDDRRLAFRVFLLGVVGLFWGAREDRERQKKDSGETTASK